MKVYHMLRDTTAQKPRNTVKVDPARLILLDLLKPGALSSVSRLVFRLQVLSSLC